ncbi:MAG: hypothetical protein R2771_06140 [Saprospiraceae bacterium]
MKKINLLLLLIMLIFNVLSGQSEQDKDKTTISLHGFVSVSAFAQDQEFKFGNGQNASWVSSDYNTDKFIKSVDIRNTRLTCKVKTKKLAKGLKSSVLVETDLFGGYNGSSAFSPSQQYFRLRLAFMELEYQNLLIRLGQVWVPLVGNPTMSLSHVAFPLGYGSAGFIGWRHPGLFTYYTIDLNDKIKLRIDAALFAGAWLEPGLPPDFLSAGDIGFPQAELRLNLLYGNSNLYVVTHIDRKDFETLGSSSIDKLDSKAVEFGGKYNVKKILIQGNYYFGVNMGHQFGALTQLQSVAKDLNSNGGWVQLGYEFNNHFAAYGYIGTESVNYNQAKELFGDSARLKHRLLDFNVQYKLGDFSIGAEVLNSKLISGLDENESEGNQYSVSALLKF